MTADCAIIYCYASCLASNASYAEKLVLTAFLETDPAMDENMP